MEVHNGDHAPKLESAILLYGASVVGKAGGFATVHPVRTGQDGIYSIGPGTPASRQGLLAALRELATDRIKPELIPAHVLAKGADHMVWYRPAQKRTVWFKCKQLGERTALVPHPATLWLVNPVTGACKIFALRDDARPDENTVLYQAPYYNVWETGGICTGNAGVPKGPDALVPENWEKMFFNSWFSHPNTPKLVRHKEGTFAFWKNLLDGKHRVFPKTKLLPVRTTLGQQFAKLFAESN